MEIIIPPLFEDTVPLLGPFQLKAYANTLSYPCKIIDLNQNFLEFVIDDSITNSKKIYNSRLHVTKDMKTFEIEACNKFITQSGIASYGEYINKLKLCSEYQEYWRLMDFVRACLDRYSLNYTNIRFRLDGLDTLYRWNKWQEVNDFVNKYEESILAKDLYKLVKRDLKFDNIIGFNITFESQLLITCLLCKIIRRINPKSFIIIGGAFVNSFIDEIDKVGPLKEYCNLVFFGEGEALIWRLSKLGDNFYDITKYCHFVSQNSFFAKPRDLCDKILEPSMPDFSDIQLEKYFSPKRIIPLRMTYRCYWKKCKFCIDENTHPCLNDGYNFDELISYCIDSKKSDRIDGIYFLDSAIPYHMLKRFCERIIESENVFPWAINARFDPFFTNESFVELVSKAGCKFIKFGLESGSQNIINKMNKGIKIKNAAKAINLCRKHNILVHTYIMFAYPGETDNDRYETNRFLLDEYSHPDNYNCSEFILYKNAPVAKELDYKFPEDDNSGWYIEAYNLSNDSIKRQIKDLRDKFEEKYMPRNVLLSTGHTLSLAGKLVSNSGNHITDKSVVKLSDETVRKRINNDDVILKWRRRDGLVYIDGDIVYTIKEHILNKKINEISQVYIPIIFELMEEDILAFDYAEGNKVVVEKGIKKGICKYGYSFKKLLWYGYYDVD